MNKRKYPLSYHARNAFAKVGAPLLGTLSIAGIPYSCYYAATHWNTLSDERTPVIGEQQYEALKSQAEKIIAKDKALQALQSSIYAQEQAQIAMPSQAQADKIAAERKKSETDLAAIKEDFRVFTRQMINSEGIAETDAIELGHMIEHNTKYAAFTYQYQTKLDKKMRVLDECQSKNAQNISDVESRITATETCLNKEYFIGAGEFVTFFTIGILGAVLMPGVIFVAGTNTGNRARKQKEELDKMPPSEDAPRVVSAKINFILPPPKKP